MGEAEVMTKETVAQMPRVIPHCPICEKPTPPMPLSDYLRNGGPMCCGIQTRIGS